MAVIAPQKKTKAERKRDIKQFKGMMEQFDEETVKEVLRERNIKTEDLYQAISKKVKDFPNVDRKTISKIGDRNHLSTEAYIEENINERIILDENFLPVHFLECGWTRQKPVARVHVTGYWWGTGFLVSRSLFMTNNHVIENETQGSAAEMEFNYQRDHDGNMLTSDTWDGDPDSYFITDPDLDYTILRLKGRRQWSFATVPSRPYYVAGPVVPHIPVPQPRPGPGPGPLGGVPMSEEALVDLLGTIFGTASIQDWMQRFYRTSHAGDTWGHIPLKDNTIAEGNRLNIIQHPSLRPKEVCVQDNKLSQIYPTAIHYYTDTEGGSSGSPVFNNSWDIVAIHHAAGDWNDVNNRWDDNEGMRIDKIIDDLQARAPANILTELGIP